jgi:L-lactate permease
MTPPVAVLTAVTLVLLSACAPLKRAADSASMENIPACEIAEPGKARAYVSSMFGWIGLSFRLTDTSAKVLCNPQPKEPTK